MKSLIYKDIVILARNSRSMLLIMLILMGCLLASGGLEAYICAISILFGMMTVSSIAYDENACWMKYAVSGPASRRQIVAGKYILMLILTVFGAVAAFLLGAAVGAAVKLVSFDAESIKRFALFSLFMIAMVCLVCGTAVALVFKFGAEKGRLYIFASAAVSAALIFGGGALLEALGVPVSDEMIVNMILLTPVLSFLWNFLMYRVSCVILEKKEIT